MGTEQPDAASQIFIHKAPLLSPSMRFAVAWLVTIVVLPYAAARVLVFALYDVMPEWRFVVLLLSGILAVVGLTYALGQTVQRTWYGRHPVWLIVLPWAACLGALVIVYNGNAMPGSIVWVIMVLSTIWVAWAAWMFFRPMRWSIRIGILSVLLLLFAGGIGLVRVNGLSGAAHMNFAWRWSGPAPINWTGPGGGAVADLTPTPDDYSQFLGPHRLGILPNARLSVDWNQSPPRELWRRPVGVGWSSFAIVGNYAFTQEQRGDNECVCCYRVQDGSPIWVHQDAVRFDKSLGGPGPRATPTVAEGRVFTVGGTGLLNCLDGTTGQRIWSANILEGGTEDYIAHGVCGSPLLVDDWVIVSPTNKNGTSLAAYDRTTGKRVWQGGTDQASYSSPILAEIGGIRQVLLFNSQGLAGHDIATGKVLWSFPWTNSVNVNVAQPVPITNGKFLIASGYDKGAACIDVYREKDGTFAAMASWQSRKPLMQAKFTTPVFYEGFVYGLDNGILACLDHVSGKRLWIDGRYGHGQILLAGDLLIVQAEDGKIVLVAPSPDGLQERGRIRAMEGKTWNNPALAGKYLLVRNDQEAVCYEVETR